MYFMVSKRQIKYIFYIKISTSVHESLIYYYMCHLFQISLVNNLLKVSASLSTHHVLFFFCFFAQAYFMMNVSYTQVL